MDGFIGDKKTAESFLKAATQAKQSYHLKAIILCDSDTLPATPNHHTSLLTSKAMLRQLR
jgi:hypothetical protein